MSQRLGITTLFVLVTGVSLVAEERYESFDKNPGWDSHNNRPSVAPRKLVKQDFGFSPTHHARGKRPGELGGLVHPSAQPAYYAKRIPTRTFEHRLTASGTVNCTGRQFHVVVGFFNSNTLNEWRTPNTISLRLYGRGDVFYAYVEYATSRWRAGGDNPRPFPFVTDPKTGRRQQKGFAANTVHRWSLTYDPLGNGGDGTVTATIDDATAVCHLDSHHKQDGAIFNRCGLMTVMKHWDDGGELWLDDITINGRTETFDHDPEWESHQNRRKYWSTDVRPRFDFGFSPTRFSGGRKKGELGGLIFRGDCRFADRMAYCADRLEQLSLAKPITAGGKISLHRAVSDSTTLIGFFHSTRSMKPSNSQSFGTPDDFLGLAIEGPSRDGFFLYPLYRFNGNLSGVAKGTDRPVILPNRKSHNWTFRYTPTGAGGRGKITVTMDRQKTVLELGQSHRLSPTHFNRFGIITTWVDGNGQRIYFDELTYTASQK